MIPTIRSTTITTSLSFLLLLGCGPGGFAMDGGELGSESTDTATPETTTTGPGDSSSGDTDTDTTGSDDWSDPDTETGDEPEPFEPAQCTRDWTLVDSQPNHGHIGATPLGARIGGGFFTVHPLLGAGNDEVNVDAWFRAWSADGVVEWERRHSWANLRDDPVTLLHGELGELYAAGRINANTMVEQAMITALDDATGAIAWTVFDAGPGTYTSLADTGAALVAVGALGSFASLELQVIALDPDDGRPLWTAEPGVPVTSVRGLVTRGGLVDVLVAGEGDVRILRFDPPQTEPSTLAVLAEGVDGEASALIGLEDGRLAALHREGERTLLTIVSGDDGESIATLDPAELDLAEALAATEVVETPAGFALAGIGTTNALDGTFVLHVDAQLEPVCLGFMTADDVPGIHHTPQLRGLVRGQGTELITSSFVDDERLGVIAHWQ